MCDTEWFRATGMLIDSFFHTVSYEGSSINLNIYILNLIQFWSEKK